MQQRSEHGRNRTFVLTLARVAGILTPFVIVLVMIFFGRTWLNTLPGASRRAMRGGGGGAFVQLFVGVFFKLLDLSVQIVAWMLRVILGPFLRVCGRGAARAMNIAAEKIAQSKRTPRRPPAAGQRRGPDDPPDPNDPPVDDLEDLWRRS